MAIVREQIIYSANGLQVDAVIKYLSMIRYQTALPFNEMYHTASNDTISTENSESRYPSAKRLIGDITQLSFTLPRCDPRL